MLAEVTTTDMTTFLGSIETFFTWCFERLTDIFTFITANPAMTILVFGFLIVGFCVSLCRRLLSI